MSRCNAMSNVVPLMSSYFSSPKFKSRLRLQAAISLLHLSTIDAYANATAADFIWLAIMVQVSAYPLEFTFNSLTHALLGSLFPGSNRFSDQVVVTFDS